MRSIRSRTLLLVLGLLAVALSAISYVSYRDARHEIEELFAAPISALANPRLVEEREVVVNGRRRALRAYHVGRHVVWGLTARILENVPDAVTVSLHCEKNFPTRKAHSDWDIPLPPGMGDEAYLQVVHDTLNYLLPIYQPDLVLYDAGVDVHRDDALGLLSLSDAGLAARDSAVLDHCLGRDIPVVGLIGGGYDKDRAVLARRHGILHHSAARVLAQLR